MAETNVRTTTITTLGTVSTEYNRFEDLHFDILTQNDILKEKLEQINRDERGAESQAVWMMDSWSAAESLEQREMEVMGHREKHVKLDESIVIMYMKILSYQSSKMSTTMKKLDYLRKRNTNQVCPADYTVQAFQEWTRTNPKIHTLQSDVLDLLAQKIRLRSHLTEEVRPKSISFRDFTGTVDQLHSQAMFYLERDPLVDADFSLHISSVAHIEANTFEANRMRAFISYCWDNKYAEDIGSDYQEFVGSMVEHIMTKYGHMRRSGMSRGDLTRDQIFAIIEGNLIPHIYDCISKTHADDEVLRQRFQELQHYGQQEIGVKDSYIDHSVQPYQDAILKLKTLSLVKLPNQKLRSIILASQAVINRMGELCKGRVAGADEFIDVWVFVTLKAAVSNLSWNLKFLKDFTNPKYMFSETGYYLSSLEMSTEYIKMLNSDQTDHHQNTALLLPDTNIIRNMCRKFSTTFEIINEQHDLMGYQFVTTLRMVRNKCRTLQFGFIETDDCTSSVKCLKVRLCTISEKELERFLQIKSSKELTIEKNKNNVLLPVFNANHDSCNATEDCVFLFTNMDDWPHILNLSTLLYLGMQSDLKSPIKASDLQEENMLLVEKLKHNIGTSEVLGNTLTPFLDGIINEIQAKLINLGYYSHLLPTDGRCCLILQRSLQRYQENINSSKGTDFLRTDGICDLKTFQCLKETVINNIPM